MVENEKEIVASPLTSEEDGQGEQKASNSMAFRRHMRRWLSVVATLVILGSLYALLPFAAQTSPQNATDKAWRALTKKDLASFKEAVNIPAFAQSLVEQALVYEQTLKNNGPTIPTGLEDMPQGISSALRADLIGTYVQQIEKLVLGGNLPKEYQGLLQKLWSETGAQRSAFVDDKVVDAHENYALVDLIFKRPDLDNIKLHLNLLLEKAPLTGQWAVTGVPNLAVFLTQIEQIRQNKLAIFNTPIRQQLYKAITLIDIQKVGGLGTGQPSVLWRVAYLNNTSEDIAKFTLKLRVYGPNGVRLKEVTFIADDPLPASSAAEVAWPMALSPNNLEDTQILNGDLKTLRIEAEVTHITFASGQTLELLKTLPQTVIKQAISEEQAQKEQK